MHGRSDVQAKVTGSRIADSGKESIMRRKGSIWTAVVGLVVALAMAGTAPAALVVYEGFAYDEGQNLVGAAGGFGAWGGAWEEVSGNKPDPTATGASLAYPDVTSTGLKAKCVNNGVKRTLASAADGAGSTYWLSCLYQGGDNNNPHDIVILNRSGSSVLTFNGGKKNGNVSASISDGSTSDDLGFWLPHDTSLLLFKFNFNGSGDDVYMWANPDASSEPAEGTADASIIGSADLSFDEIVVGRFANKTYYADEIRLGENSDQNGFQDAISGTGAAPIPEPLTVLGFVAGAGALAGYLRRRKAARRAASALTAVVGLIVVLAMAGSAPALTMVWDGSSDGDGDGTSWNDANNWDLDAVPGATDTAQFGKDPNGTIVVPGGGATIDKLAFEGDDGGHTLTGGKITASTLRVNTKFTRDIRLSCEGSYGTIDFVKGTLVLGDPKALGTAPALTLEKDKYMRVIAGSEGIDLSNITVSSQGALTVSEVSSAAMTAPSAAIEGEFASYRTDVDAAFDLTVADGAELGGSVLNNWKTWAQDITLDAGAPAASTITLGAGSTQGGGKTQGIDITGKIDENGKTLSIVKTGKASMKLNNANNAISGTITIEEGAIYGVVAGGLGSASVERLLVDPADKTNVKEGDVDNTDPYEQRMVPAYIQTAPDVIPDTTIVELATGEWSIKDGETVDPVGFGIVSQAGGVATVGGYLVLDYDGTDLVGQFIVDGEDQGFGVFDSASHPNRIAGTGRIEVVSSVPIPEPVSALAVMLGLSGLGGYMRRRRG
jgi:hypothetical protein